MSERAVAQTLVANTDLAPSLALQQRRAQLREPGKAFRIT